MNSYQEIVKAAAMVFKEKRYHAATVQDMPAIPRRRWEKFFAKYPWME